MFDPCAHKKVGVEPVALFKMTQCRMMHQLGFSWMPTLWEAKRAKTEGHKRMPLFLLTLRGRPNCIFNGTMQNGGPPGVSRMPKLPKTSKGKDRRL